MPISFTTAALGGEIEIPTLDGYAKIKIPAETQIGKVFRLRGKGIKGVRSQSLGDLLCHVVVETPVNLTARQKELLQELEEINEQRRGTPQSARQELDGQGQGILRHLGGISTHSTNQARVPFLVISRTTWVAPIGPEARCARTGLRCLPPHHPVPLSTTECLPGLRAVWFFLGPQPGCRLHFRPFTIRLVTGDLQKQRLIDLAPASRTVSNPIEYR